MSSVGELAAGGAKFSVRLKPLWGYAIKAFVLCVIFALYGAFAPVMPPALIAVFWAATVLVSSAAAAYQAVVRKLGKRITYQEGGRLARLNEGRIVLLVIVFVCAAVCSACLLIDVPSWKSQDWAMLIIAALLAPVVFALVERFNSKEYNELFRMAKSIVASGIALCVLLCLVGVVCAVLIPSEQYGSALEAFQSVPKPFENSSSSLMEQAGLFASFCEGLTAFFMSRAADVSVSGYSVLWVGMHAAGFLALASMISSCLLPLSELRRIILPLGAVVTDYDDVENGAGTQDKQSVTAEEGEVALAAQSEEQIAIRGKRWPFGATGVIARYAVTCAVLPIALIAGFIAVDAVVASDTASQERSWVQELVNDQIGLSVYVLDGKYYDQQAVDQALSEIRGESEQLVADAQQNLVPLINDSFDKRIANVDSYLDWYYSLPADYDRLAKVFTGTIEEGLKQQLEEKLSQNVDDSQLNERYSEYLEKASALQEELQEKLSQSEIGNMPSWLINVSTLEQSAIDSVIEPSQKLMETWQRMGVSAATGVIAGVIAKKAATKVFKKLAQKISAALARRGIVTLAVTAVGTVIEPGGGTAAGAVVGTAASVGIDYFFLKADEVQNRETYKQELIDSLNERRDQMIAAIS